MKYNDWAAISVKHGKRDIWVYTNFAGGLKFTQVLTAEKAAAVLKGLRSTPWKEKIIVHDNYEIWRFEP